MSTEGYHESPPHKKLGFFFTLVNGLNLLSIVTENDLRCCVGPRYASGMKGLRL